jgi:hypothetical protein
MTVLRGEKAKSHFKGKSVALVGRAASILEHDEEIDKLFAGTQDLEPLRKIVEGKRVIYVGPSPTLKGRGMGEFIDSFDVVVRSNNMYKVPEELWVDYGKRCDVACFNNHFIRCSEVDVQHIINDNIKIFSKISVKTQKSFVGKFVANKLGQPVFVDEEGGFKEKKPQALTTGLHFVKLILLCQPSVLHFTGVDFYLSDVPHVYSYASNKRINEMFSKYHNRDSEIAFFLNHLSHNEKLEIDDFLSDLLMKRGLLC